MVRRRHFLKQSSTLMLGAGLTSVSLNSCAKKPMDGNKIVKNTNGDNMFFKISLAEWSFHKSIFGGKLKHLDFAAKTKSLGMNGIEYVNQFFKDKAEDFSFLNQMNQAAADNGVTQLLIMIDGEGGLGAPDDTERNKAVEKHYKWVNAAKYLGCHSIRVNAFGEGSAEDVGSAAVQGLGALAEYGAKENINVIVENHGGYSSDGAWLSNVMKQINMPNCGTLPDFGNFCTKRKKGSWDCEEEYDRYKGVEEMMPFAKAVSAKAHNFDASGNEPQTDFVKMMSIVKDHGYTGYVGIEYEGQSLSEEAGIIATRDLLLKVGKQLS